MCQTPNHIMDIFNYFSCSWEVKMQLSLSVKDKSIETSGITKDYKEALCEFIWNSFEANATEVIISYTKNELSGINSICISDNGDGIVYEDIEDTFGTFLASKKKILYH